MTAVLRESAEFLVYMSLALNVMGPGDAVPSIVAKSMAAYVVSRLLAVAIRTGA